MKPVIVIACAAALAACQKTDSPPTVVASPSPPASAPTSMPTSMPASAPASQPIAAGDTCGPWLALAALDPRQPVPLQPVMAWHQKQNMQAHLVAIEGIVRGLAEGDWAAAAAASATIESSPSMQSMCQHMGAGADGFTDLALDFHHRADEIGAALKARDTTRALAATAHTLQSCTGCHARYRQDVVDAETWQARTGAPTPGAQN